MHATLKKDRRVEEARPQGAALHSILAAIVFASCQAVNVMGEPEKPTQDSKAITAVEPVKTAVPAWPLFHGDASLTGTVDAQLPEKFEKLWKTSVGKTVTTTPIAGGDRIYCLHDMEKVTALKYDGTKIWTKAPVNTAPKEGATSEIFLAPIMYVGEAVIVASSEGGVYSLDAATGDTKWRYDAGGRIAGTPGTARNAEGKDLVFVLLQAEGVVHAIDAATGKKLWVSAQTARCDGHMSVGSGRIVMGNCSGGFHVLSTQTGNIDSFVSLGGGDSQMAGGAALLKDVAYAGNRSGGVAAADLKEGKVLWMNQDGQGELFSTPAVNGANVVFCSGDGKVICLERATGKKVWAVETQGGDQHSPVIAGNKVVAAAGDTLYVIAIVDGAKFWTTKVADVVRDPIVINNMIIMGTDDGQLMAFGSAKGEKK